jgi:beta-glucosidase
MKYRATYTSNRAWLHRAIPILALLVFAVGTRDRAPGQITENDAQPKFLNTSLPIEQRVDDLVSRMTMEEKASQLVHQAAAIPRLHVPAYNWWSEALHGVAFAGKATVFPEPIGLAASWDEPLIRQMADVIGTEARAKHNEALQSGHGGDIMHGLTFWSPNINIFRDPRWGRGQETYGEDPFLTARLGVAFVKGLQGDDPKYLKAVSTPKHYAVHSGPEPLRHVFDAKVSKHDMVDTYLPAFRETVMQGRAESVMCAYNSINGEPACANTFLLQDELRNAWGFNGYVVSDCDAVADIQRGHHFTKAMEGAAAISLKKGTDLECEDKGNNYSKYVDAVKQGLLTERDLDVAVKRLFRARFKLGMFDPPEMVTYARISPSENDIEAHRQLALKLARETMVLLKNDGILPLKAGPTKVAVVGPLADSVRVLEGNYNGTPSRATTALEGIRKRFGVAQVAFMPGTKFLRPGSPVPSEVLTTEDGRPGLKAEYFNGTELGSTPVAVRVDPSVNFEFGGSPAPGLGGENFSVRWTGRITPSQSEMYEVGVTGDDGFRLWVDGKLIVEDWSRHAPRTKTAPITLKKGRHYALKLEYFQGGGGAVAKLVWVSNKIDPLADAIKIVKQADVTVAVVGITSDLEGEEMDVQVPGFKGGDRTSIDLPQEEETLLKAVKATGRPLIVVLMNGSALAVNWAQAHADAIIDAWYPGEEGGTAIADTLAGSNNPAGRLPVTFYTGVNQLPPFEDYSMKGRTYRYFEGQPLYQFGFGLSYSKFTYDDLKLSAKKLEAGQSLDIDVDVRNTSERDGDEVVQVYLKFPHSPGAPLRALRGFTRVHVAAGQKQHLHFSLEPQDLGQVNQLGNRLVASGEYLVSVGGGQPGTGAATLEDRFSIDGERKLPE